MPSATCLQRLTRPPIIELVCGFRFPALLAFDAVLAGVYWHERRIVFTRHEIHPAILDAPAPGMGFPIVFGAAASRAWLVSEHDDLVLQLQGDRFYLNWRRRSSAYPTFSGDPDQKIVGLKDRVLEEFEQFAEFCKREVGDVPKPTSIELAKIDLFHEGSDWDAGENLSHLFSWLRPMVEFSGSGVPQLALRFYEPRPGGDLTISIECGTTAPGFELFGAVPNSRVVKLESRVTAATGASQDEIRATLEAANLTLNEEVFSKLIPSSELHKRFGTRGS